MNKRTYSSVIGVILVISISSIFAIVSYINPLPQQQLAYAQSPKTPDLKNDVKQNLNQDNLCQRSDGCKQPNEGQQIVGKDNAAAGFNDQSTTNVSSLSSGTGASASGIPGPAGTNGERGPEGPTGPAGPPRELQIVERTSEEPVTVQPADGESASANCQTGELAIGGGYSMNSFGLPLPTVVREEALPGNTGWQVTVFNPNSSPDPVTFVAIAECIRLIP